MNFDAQSGINTLRKIEFSDKIKLNNDSLRSV